MKTIKINELWIYQIKLIDDHGLALLIVLICKLQNAMDQKNRAASTSDNSVDHNASAHDDSAEAEEEEEDENADFDQSHQSVVNKHISKACAIHYQYQPRDFPITTSSSRGVQRNITSDFHSRGDSCCCYKYCQSLLIGLHTKLHPTNLTTRSSDSDFQRCASKDL